MDHQVFSGRYDTMKFRRCGHSGIKLPRMSLGLWHNFGNHAVFSNSRDMVCGAFDRGITHFDLANNYGPEAGSAEETFGIIINRELKAYRDEILISTKAGYYMWPGPYGEWGSKKSLVSSLDQSLKRLRLDYVDIFYHHRPDPDTPLQETVEALAGIVRSGKALYVGISNYAPAETKEIIGLLADQGIHCLIHQMKFSLLDRSNEAVLDVLEREKVGAIAFSPLAQGLLTGKYLNGIPKGSRADGNSVFLSESSITSGQLETVKRLKALSDERGQSLSQMALAWVLNAKQMASVILGASSLDQITDNLKALDHLEFSSGELAHIDSICP